MAVGSSSSSIGTRIYLSNEKQQPTTGCWNGYIGDAILPSFFWDSKYFEWREVWKGSGRFKDVPGTPNNQLYLKVKIEGRYQKVGDRKGSENKPKACRDS